MADENGTLLARQVRRFIEKSPTYKTLENVEEDAKTAILQLGNPDYYADESEKTVPIPLDFYRKASFEAVYKKLQKEYPTLPDLKDRKEGKDDGKGNGKDKEDRERKDKEDRERKDKEDRERKDKEDRERKDKEDRERKDKEDNQSDLLDRLRTIPIGQLRSLMQDLGISSRGSSATSHGTSNTSGQGSRENTTSSWNTRESSAESSLQTSGRWRKSDLTDLAIEFINHCPGSQAELLKDLSEKDPQLKRAYDRYYVPLQLLGETKERRAWARNPQAYRDRLFEGLPPEKEEHWDQITLLLDPDTKKKNVQGRITASVSEFLDVCLPSLKNNDEERHYLALKSDYPKETLRFEESKRGVLLTIKLRPKGTLKGRLKSDIKILNYSCADQPYPDANPRMYFFGIDKKNKNVIRAWARTTYCETKEFKGGLDDLNDQRKECGQKEITIVSRIHRRWPNRDTGSNSDSNSDFDSDDELANGVERIKI